VATHGAVQSELAVTPRPTLALAILGMAMLLVLLGLGSHWYFLWGSIREPTYVATALDLTGAIMGFLGGLALIARLRGWLMAIIWGLACTALLGFVVADSLDLASQLDVRHRGGNVSMYDLDEALGAFLFFNFGAITLLCCVILYAMACRVKASAQQRGASEPPPGLVAVRFLTLRNLCSGAPLLAGAVVWLAAMSAAMTRWWAGRSGWDDALLGTVWLAPALLLAIMIRLVFATVRPEPGLPRGLAITGLLLSGLLVLVVALRFLFVLGAAAALGH